MGDDEAGERTRDGIEHLQAAAKELIAAGRAFLDAAEGLVEDPGAVRQAVGALGTLAKLAGAAAAGHDRSAPPPDEEPKVQRIRVS